MNKQTIASRLLYSLVGCGFAITLIEFSEGRITWSLLYLALSMINAYIATKLDTEVTK